MFSVLLRSERLKTALAAVFLLLMMLGLILYPSESLSAAKTGLLLCGNVIIPSLFPFFVLSNLTIELGLAALLGQAMEGVMRPLFRVRGGCALALVLGAVGGYPVGARTAIGLYRQGLCSKTEAERLLAFCNNSGPAFILGVVGVGVFASSRVGLLLYLCHIAASLLVGVVFRFYRAKEPLPPLSVEGEIAPSHGFAAAFTRSVTGAMTSALNICAFVIFFAVFTRLLTATGLLSLLTAALAPLGVSPETARALLTGALELTGGVTSLTGGDLTHQVPLAAFLLGWAGLSIHCQVLSFLADSGLASRTYFLGKLLHGALSAALTYAVTRLLRLEESVSVLLGQQVRALSTLDFSTSFLRSAQFAWAVFLIFVFFGAWAGKRRKSMVK